MKKWYAGVFALVIIVGGAILWHNRISVDFWPLDNSRVGPNLTASIVQWAIIALVVYLAYPPVRKAIDRWASSHYRAASADLHAKLDHNAKLLAHVIKHSPDIPNEDHTGASLIEPKGKP